MRLFLYLALAATAFAADRPQFDAQGNLLFPTDYRDWVYLSSGLGMTYGPAAAQNLVSPMFDNVFVNPPAYAAYKATGKWPESTIFVLEIRYSVSQGSINKGGFYQSDVFSIEAAVKDTKRFEKGWAYFNFAGGLLPSLAAAKPFDRKATCYGCHEPNGAVENTFTQFYPTALGVAEKYGTVKASYTPPAPSPVRLFHSIQAQGAAAAAVLDKAKTDNPTALALRENNLNLMGYALLQQGDRDRAIAVFQWTAAAYPQSANAQDSLSEAYETAGHGPGYGPERQGSAGEGYVDPEPRRPAIEKAIDERIARLSGK